MSARLFSLLRDRHGAAAAEMALVAPLLLILSMGSFELGKYFLDEHVVAKAMRDAARYAGRRSFSEYVDGSGNCIVGSDVVEDTKDVARFGKLNPGTNDKPRLGYWTDEATITVTASCDMSGTYTGIYRDNDGGAPVVTVSATVPYEPLFGPIAFASGDLSLVAASQAPVSGI